MGTAASGTPFVVHGGEDDMTGLRVGALASTMGSIVSVVRRGSEQDILKKKLLMKQKSVLRCSMKMSECSRINRILFRPEAE